MLPLDSDYDERAVYVVSGEVDIAGQTFGVGRLLVFRPGDRISILAVSMARLMLVGGEPMDGYRHIWWNFVASDNTLIDDAVERWHRMDAATGMGQVQGETEFIPVPNRPARKPGA